MRVNLLLLSATIFGCYFGIAWTACKGSMKIECMTKGQCIRLDRVCNGGRDCTDNSDEDPQLCKIWAFNVGHCNNSRVSCNGNCYNFPRFCNKKECAAKISQRVCQMVREKKFNIAEAIPPPASLQVLALTTTIEDVSQIEEREEAREEEQQQNEKVVVIEEEDEEEEQEEEEEEEEVKIEEVPDIGYALPAYTIPPCPALYTRVGHRCLALFTPAKVPWTEARAFCKSIHGELVDFDVVGYADLLRFIRDALFTADFWIGGRYDPGSTSWAWVKDNSAMPLGTPFWAERKTNVCHNRSPPQIDPSSDPPAALPGAPCYFFVQRPEKREDGWCAGMTQEHHYYITDELCQKVMSPVCVLTERPHDSSYLYALARP